MTGIQASEANARTRGTRRFRPDPWAAGALRYYGNRRPARTHGSWRCLFPDGKYLAASLGNRSSGIHSLDTGTDGGRRYRHYPDRGKCGLARHRLRLPRPAHIRMGAGSAAGDASLCRRVCLHRYSGIRRPGTGAAARYLRLAHSAGLLVPRDPLSGRRDRRDDNDALPLCLPADAFCVSRTILRRRRSGADPRLLALGGIPARIPADGTSVHCRRRCPCPDGNAE